MYKAFKYKLLPTADLKSQFKINCDNARFLWNKLLELNILYYENTKQFLFAFDLNNVLPYLKKEYNWLQSSHSQSLQDVSRLLANSLKAVWEQNAGFPKFHSKYQNKNSFYIPQNYNKNKPNTSKHIKVSKDYIILPKLGKIKWIKHRNLEGKLKGVTIKEENGDWYAICICELPDVTPIQDIMEDEVIGIDLGISNFAVTSDGEIVKPENFYRKAENKLKREQQKLSKKQKNSKNREKQRNIIAKISKKIKNKRNDFCHQLSSRITKENMLIGIENLNITGMVTNRNLAKSISDQGWKIFTNQLEYKMLNKGGKTVKIDRWAPSTKTCSNCGNKQNISLDERVYSCNACGFESDRDFNASLNIRNWVMDEVNRNGTFRIYDYEFSTVECVDEVIKETPDWGGSPIPLGVG